MKKLFCKIREESGAALVIVALSITVLMGFTALTIDGGRMYSAKSNLQKVLDAAVLAGAQGLRVNESTAIANALTVASQNGIPIAETDLTITSSSVKATKEISIPLTFARVLGLESSTIGASAKAVVGHLRRANGIAPIAIEESQVPHGTDLTCFNTGNNQGNCGFLALDGTGAPSLETAIRNGSTFDVGNEVTVDTEPGQKWGPVSGAINDLIASDADKPHCQSPDTADYLCNRLIYVVIIDTFADTSGRGTVNVTGLAAYWIDGFVGKKLTGQFIERVAPGDIGTVTSGTLFGVKLVE